MAIVPLMATSWGAGVLELGTQRYLLFDDDWLEPGYSVTFVQHLPQKAGVVLEADKPWEAMGIWPWNTVMLDDGLFRMWYDAMIPGVWDGSGGRYKAHLAYATSRDGIHWEKPELGVYEFEGSTANNVVAQFTGLYGAVFKDPTGPDERRYKTCYPGIRVAWSPDGIHWTHTAKRRVMEHTTDSSDVMFWDDRIGKYVGYLRFNDHSPETKSVPRQVWRAESDDFEDWPKPELNFCHDPALDPPATDFYNNGVIKYPWAHHAYFMRPSAFHHPSDRLDIHLATSRDGISWRRAGAGQPWIGLGPEGSFDSHQMYIASGIVRVGDELWMYYTGYTAGHRRILVKESRFVGKIARAVLRLDGFVSARAGLEPAALTTRPLQVAGRSLIVNYDAGAIGEVRAELRDAAGKAVPGYTLDDCKPLFGNQVHGLVAWKKGSDLSGLTAAPVRLHLLLRNADVYAFEFRE